MPPGTLEKTRHFGDIQGGGCYRHQKRSLDTALNVPRSSLSILKKLLLIMLIVFPLCGYVCINS